MKKHAKKVVPPKAAKVEETETKESKEEEKEEEKGEEKEEDPSSDDSDADAEWEFDDDLLLEDVKWKPVQEEPPEDLSPNVAMLKFQLESLAWMSQQEENGTWRGGILAGTLHYE